MCRSQNQDPRSTGSDDKICQDPGSTGSHNEINVQCPRSVFKIQWHWYCSKSKTHKIPQQIFGANSTINRIQRYLFVWDPRFVGSHDICAAIRSRICKIPRENENMGSNILRDPGYWILRIKDSWSFYDLDTCFNLRGGYLPTQAAGRLGQSEKWRDLYCRPLSQVSITSGHWPLTSHGAASVQNRSRKWKWSSRCT